MQKFTIAEAQWDFSLERKAVLVHSPRYSIHLIIFTCVIYFHMNKKKRYLAFRMKERQREREGGGGEGQREK